MKKALIISLFLAISLFGSDSALGFDLPEKILEKFEYCGISPVIQVDNQGFLHVLFTGLNISPNDYRSYGGLHYYKYRIKDFKLVDSYSYNEELGIYNLEDLNITDGGDVYFMYGHLNMYSMSQLYLLTIRDGKSEKIGIEKFSGRWNAVLPDNRFLILGNGPLVKSFTIYQADGSTKMIGKPASFTKQCGRLPYAMCVNVIRAVPEMIYLGDSVLLVACYGAEGEDGKSWVETCREKSQYLMVFTFDISLDSMTAYRTFDLYSDPDVERTELGYKRISAYATNDGLIHIVAGRAYPDETGKLCYITVDKDLNPIKSNSLAIKRGTESYSLTDPGIDHQIFWLKPSEDSNYVGNLMRYVFVDNTLYYSESEPIYARARVAIREREEAIRQEMLKRHGD